jgi:hypothetical protein
MMQNIYTNTSILQQPQTIQSSDSHSSLSQELLERRLVNDDVTHRAQTLAASLLLLQQLPTATNVTGMQLGKDILAEWLDGLTRNNALANSSLDDDLCEQLASNTRR